MFLSNLSLWICYETQIQRSKWSKQVGWLGQLTTQPCAEWGDHERISLKIKRHRWEKEAVFRNPGGIFLLQYKMINKAHRQTIKRKLIDKRKKES